MSPETRAKPGPQTPSVEELRRGDERFQLAARASQDVMWDWDLVRGEITWAGITRPFFGRSPHEFVPKRDDQYRVWAERVHPEDLPSTEAAARAAIEGGADGWEQEYRFRRVDGSYAHMLERAFIARDATGRALRVVGAMQDITARKEAERASIRLSAIVASSSDAIVGKTLHGVITSWNVAAERIFGYSEREMVGCSIFTLIPEELHDAERDLLARIARGERAGFADTERIRKDGRRINVAVTVSPIWDASGTVVGASSIKRDITERKRAEEELARREERYRAVVIATTQIVWTTDPEGRFIEPQQSWEQYTGQSWDEYAGFGWLSAVHPEDRDLLTALWFEARDRRAIYEGRGRLWSQAHQSHRHFVSRAAPVLGRDGSLREWIGTVTDVEDHWLAEERLRQADRMESVGRLAGGIAHEANNQMTVILGVAEFLSRTVRDETARGDLEQIRRAARRTAAITQQLLAFSRRQVLQPQLLDLNDVVTSLEPIIQRALGELSTVELQLADDLGQVKADRGQLDQVLLNLTLNARDAMPDGGTLTIETANVAVDERYSAGRTPEPIAPGRYAVLTVRDTGIGMDPQIISHIFEPFFTTKVVGEGTGLGLATVYGVVKQSGGFVSVESEPDHGATFRVYLPLAGHRGDATPVVQLQEPAGGSETVLVAEDEPAVRAVIARALREYGYTVIEARDGAHALELAEGRPAPPDLVIADLVMPGMGGRQLAAELSARWSALPVLFISGYTGPDALRRGVMLEGDEFMQKPLEPEAVAWKVRQILDARGAAPGSDPGPVKAGR